MGPQRNQFLEPKFGDAEYLITKLRRDDLQCLCDLYHGNEKSETVDILDFGARKAPYQDLFRGIARSYKCADMPDEGEDREIDVLILPDGKLDMPDSSVDLVLSLQVLEHVPDVELYLEEAFRVLKPGGTLWLTTHGMWPFHPTPTDYYRWTLSGLIKTVGTRFEIFDTHAMMGAPAYSIMIFVRRLWDITRWINSRQSVILNKITGERWGKTAPRDRRITNKYMYAGNLIFIVFGGILNMMMECADLATSVASKDIEAAVYRIAAIKSK